MATYLLPEDISQTDATMVLEFLNAAQNTEEIAIAVVLPDELDIGMKIAGRILARRDQLGGFTSLQQIYAVPYIGPERFNELVTSLSTAVPPKATDNLSSNLLLSQLTERLEQLEAASSKGPTIRLTAINSDALLGQETTLLAELKDSDGQPLVDHELTILTTWGLLSGRAGIQSVEGNSITLRSDHLGLCRIKLSASLGEALTAEESAALSQSLSLLDAANDDPRDSMAELTEIARNYRSPGNAPLRRAIDAYFKHYGGSQVEAPTDSLASWPRIQVTIVAFLPPASGQLTSQVTTTLLDIQQRNWFFAWLWAYRQLLESESQLGASLIAVRGDNRSGSGILSDLFSRIGGFVKAQEGLVGQQLGQTFAANSLNHYLQTGLDSVPFEERTKVVTGVTSGVKSLGSHEAFYALESERLDFNLEIESRIDNLDTIDPTQLKDIESRITQIELSSVTFNDLDSIKKDILADASQATENSITKLKNELTLELESKADITRVATLEESALTQDDISAIKAEILADANSAMNASIDKLREEFANNMATKADISLINQIEENALTLDDITTIKKEILTDANKTVTASINKLRDEFNANLEGKADISSITQIDTELATLKRQNQTFDTSLKQVNTRLKGVDKRIDNINNGGRRRP